MQSPIAAGLANSSLPLVVVDELFAAFVDRRDHRQSEHQHRSAEKYQRQHAGIHPRKLGGESKGESGKGSDCRHSPYVELNVTECFSTPFS